MPNGEADEHRGFFDVQSCLRALISFESRKRIERNWTFGTFGLITGGPMTKIRFLPLPSEKVSLLRCGGLDAYGCAAEHTVSDGLGNPCRHCLTFIPKNAGMLILAYRPFDRLQPYAETGPIFLCADDCTAWSGVGMPPMLASSEYLLKGYTLDQRICYGTGRILATNEIASYASELLERDDIDFVDARSARNNCFQVRIVRSN